MYNAVSLAGCFVLVGMAWLFSTERRRINGRVLFWGIALQLLTAYVLFRVPAGTAVFEGINHVVLRVLDSASAGSRFLFGRLALPPGTVNEAGEESLGFILAFQAFPTIVFFSSLMAVLYFLRIMPWIIKAFAAVFTRLMRISGVESLVTASNIFVGVESCLTVKPFLERCTRSELCTILTAGMATVASNVLAIYVFSLKQYFPSIAGHLISASLLSAPAALVMSKMLCPETQEPQTRGVRVALQYERDHGLFEAVMNGAQAGMKMIVGIVTLLVALLGLMALFDQVLGFLGGRLNMVLGMQVSWNLRSLLGYLFYPFTLLLGVVPADAGVVSRIIGERLVVTEVVAYQDLAAALASGALQSGRSTVIAAYALCGFAHIASMAIFVAATSALAPSRTREITSVAWRALCAATLACLQTACVAGVFCTEATFLLGR